MNIPSVLIVEDDEWLAEQYSRALKGSGYQVSIVPHALAAIQKIDDSCPDAIILDVLLTGSTAFALLNELQSYGDTGKIPIILCTNMASELSIDNLKLYGVKQIIDKTTMVPGDLALALQDVLS